MNALEKEPFEPPTINPWRQAPTTDQKRYALDLCRSELTHDACAAEVERFPTMSGREMSHLIDRLKAQRAGRLRQAPRNRRWRLAPLGRSVDRA